MSRSLLVSAMLLVLAATPLSAQTSGEITGHITDSSAGAVPGAAITLTNTATNAVRTALSTDAGVYTFPAVAPGLYNLKVEQTGFKTASANVQVQVQQTVRLDFTLEVGEITDTIEVAASAQMLQSENMSLGTVIETKGITELPLNGRNYLSLVALASNTNTLSAMSGQAGGRQGGDRASQSISAGGNRIMFNYFTLDGVTNTDPNFYTYVVLPSVDAIQEFKVQTGVYPAEFGHQATQINVVTKSGGNVFHGALFEFVRNNAFDAKPYQFTTARVDKSPFKWNDYGFEADGPVRIPKLLDLRDRLFFMVNAEWRAQRAERQAVYTVPTAKMFAGDFSELLPAIKIYDPNTAVGGATKTPFLNNIIPADRIDPISKKFLKYYVSSNLPGLSNNYAQVNTLPNNREAFTLRMDFNESTNSQWTGRWSRGDEDQSSTGISITGSKILTDYDQFLFTNTRTLSPSLVNEARVGYTKFANALGTYSAYETDAVSDIGIPGLAPGDPVSWGVPMASFAGGGFVAIGDAQDGPYAIDDNILQLVNNVSWTHGSHSFRFGGEYTRENYNQVGNQFSRGQFAFQPNTTQGSDKTGGDAFAEFMLGHLWNSIVAVALAQAEFQRNSMATFVDDTWKVTPKLTLSLGLRYELTPPWTNQLNNLARVFVPEIMAVPDGPAAGGETPYYLRQGDCTDPYAGPPPINIRWTTVTAKCNNGMLPDQLMYTSYRDFAPRIGIAYSPSPKTVIRTGYGIFYNQDIGNAYFDLARSLGGRVTLQAEVGTPSLFYSNAVPGGGAVANVPSPYAYSMSVDHRTTYTMQYLFNIQRQLTPNWAIEAGYLGSVSRHLQGFLDANQGIPGTTGSPSTRRPWKGFSNIQYVHDGGNGNYNSLSLKATRRFSEGLNVISSYTWAKSLDTTSGIRNQGFDTLYPQNSYCIACERGPSAFDVTHRMVTSVLYDLPVGKGKRLGIDNAVVNTMLGGWSLGGILTMQSGMPGNLTMGGLDNASTGSGGYDRPNATSTSPYLDDPKPYRYWNLDAFVVAPAGQFGNAGRNSVRGPGIFLLDAEVHKQFALPYKEGHVFQFRFEAFNVLNHPNWGMPNLNIRSGAARAGVPDTAARQNFGVVTSTSGSMRQIQFGLKYLF
ncbi:MAG: TonB-dependent receptor [Acidobacteria bacterium]|nr:MAG: TonB-dependent receptor [Acidobacteriota bacterium]